MSRTLLYTVQRVLEKLDLDEVNSINDSQDAILIAREAEDTLYDLINRNEWPERYELIQLESVTDLNNPTALRLSNDTINIKSIRYDTTETGETDKDYKELIQLSPEDFLDKVYSRSSSDTDVTTATYNGIELYVYNNQPPQYFTVFDNETILLDSYDSDVETTVQGNKTVCRGSVIPSFTMDDTYVLPLDLKTYPLYLSELTAACSIALNGTAAPEEERRRNRAISRLRRESGRVEKESTKNKFGRNGTGRS